MFGGPLECPKKPKPTPWPNKLHDITMPCQQPYNYGHNARTPNSNYSVQLLHYRQRLREILEKMSKSQNKNEIDDKIFLQYFKHYQKKDLQREIKQRVDVKIKAADEALERRRERLLDMLSQEESEFFYETVDKAQRGKESKLAEMKEKAQQIKAKREAERMKIVEEKRFLQFRDQNDLLRPALMKLHNVESKMVNLQQIRENEAKRSAEREIDKFYHDILMKNVQEQMIREEQDAIRLGEDMRKTVDTWDQQVRGKELLKKAIEEVKDEDRDEIQKNMRQLKEELAEERRQVQREKQKRNRDLTNQIALREKFLAQRQKEIDALDKAFAHLNDMELAKEKRSGYESRLQARKEMMTYKKYIADLRQRQMEEERQTQAVLEADQKEIQQKHDDAKCKIKAAKEKLRQEVFAIRDKQLVERKQLREEEKERETEFVKYMKKTIEIDECLEKEAQRAKKEEVLKYRDDLCKQMEYNRLIKEREKQEEEKELKLCAEEEERYLELVHKMVQEKIEGGSKHPFREVFEDFECYCKEEEKKKI